MLRRSPRARALARAGAFAVAGFVPVLVLAWFVRTNATVQDADQAVVDAAVSVTLDNDWLLDTFVVWSAVTQPGWVVLAGGAVALWMWRRHDYPGRALWAVGTLLASWGLANLAKEAVGRVRPVVDEVILNAPGLSFPSGHATSSATAAVTITLLVWPVLGRVGRVVVPLVATLFVLITAADRIFLGVHFPSDVVAGILLGVTISGASYLGYRGWSPTTRTTDAEIR
ncbi:phosphatase PAP2 family protein [Isoptericola sediminis]|uniref:Phosphatase PAP2 family protein n=1 Tax=Isoptericola sediminis TaxID=2733572 RepID=A0A849K5N1_9MICO|nr:phosphatase PAP2 family protein [Isoptericola sediminis]NNU27085.1 phosphatase PAP2 family protein [Isoptericola sediminis]